MPPIPRGNVTVNADGNFLNSFYVLTNSEAHVTGRMRSSLNIVATLLNTGHGSLSAVTHACPPFMRQC